MARSMGNVPFGLILSYVFDWVIIIAIAGIGGAFWHRAPNRRPFSPVDPNISYPYTEHEKVPTAALFLIAFVAPILIIAAIAAIFTPNAGPRHTTRLADTWKLKMWEINVAWMGLCLALAISFFATEGMKNLFGKPRPDLLARCRLDPATVQQYALGGFGNQLPQWNILVSWTACKEGDTSKLRDGFQSFPSGHSSFSWTGMFYLALYLCSKFGIAIPYLTNWAGKTKSTDTNAGASDEQELRRAGGAAPPTWTMILPLIPISVAIYVSATRFSDFRHHGFDILFGSLMGILVAYIGFRLYHMPISQGSALSWGPRSSTKAWFRGLEAPFYTELHTRMNTHNVQQGSLGDSHNPTTLNNGPSRV